MEGNVAKAKREREGEGEWGRVKGCRWNVLSQKHTHTHTHTHMHMFLIIPVHIKIDWQMNGIHMLFDLRSNKDIEMDIDTLIQL